MLIRKETNSDVDAIGRITEEAFRDHPFSVQTERYIIEALRAAGALSVSLVAELDGKVVGHVAFSPIAISDGTAGWYGLGPVSVLPEHQGRGIGSRLIREGLAALKAAGGRGCALVGEPEFYVRFGFKNRPELVLEGVPPENFLVLPFHESETRGTVVFHEGFTATA